MQIKSITFFTVTSTVLLLMSKVHASNFLDKPSVVTYWGQNSRGTADSQGSLASYCDDNTDVLIMSFVLTFKDGSLPSLNLASSCNGPVFPGTELLQCTQVGADIKTCQEKGKTILMSLGGANGAYGFTSDANAEAFADTLWNLFGAGKSETRPFGDAVLDGFDLDIESGGPIGYAAMVNRLRKNFAKDSSKDYYITAAPQCPYPDAMLGPALDAAAFDFVNVQFYNNYCSTLKKDFNFETWDKWAKSSKNSKVKIFMGLPGSSAAAGSGYVEYDTLKPIVEKLQSTYSNFGGVTLWDASASYANKDTSPSYQSAIAGLVHGFTGGAKEGDAKEGGTDPTEDTNPTEDTDPTENTDPAESTDPAEPAKSNTDITNETITDGSDCSPEGKMSCSGDLYATCVYGKWLLRDCGSPAICFPTSDHSSIYCDLPKSNATKRSLSVEGASSQKSNATKRSLSVKGASPQKSSTKKVSRRETKEVADGSNCSSEGQMICSGSLYAICAEAKWLVRDCGLPYICFPTSDHSTMYCDIPKSNTTKRSLSVEDTSSQKK